MPREMKRRDFLQLSVAGTALGLGASSMAAFAAGPTRSKLISPGCRRSKVKVARLYLGNPHGHWPAARSGPRGGDPLLQGQRSTTLKDELADVEFVVDQLVTSAQQVEAAQGQPARRSTASW